MGEESSVDQINIPKQSTHEHEKCPKCGGTMREGSLGSSGGVRVLKSGDIHGDAVTVYYCENCGFIELYKEPSTKEPWRFKHVYLARARYVPEETKQEEKDKPSRRREKRRLVR